MSVKKRNFWTMLLLSIVTCGLYGLYWWFCFVEDTNRICEGKSDEKPSPNYIVVILLSAVTCGIYFFIWMYKQGNRLADAAQSYDIRNQATGSTLLLWYLFGSLLCGLGPLIALNTWIGLFNKVADAYNAQLPGGGYPGGGYPGGGNHGGGNQDRLPASEAASGVAAVAQKMEQGAGNLAGKIQGSKGFSDIKKMVEDKVPGFQKNNGQLKNVVNSKTRSMAPGNVRSANTAELWHSEAPVILTRVQITELGQEGDAGLFIGFQNMAEKSITAIYMDVVCYNVLKEQLGVLTDVSYIDLKVEKGQVFELQTPIALPDKSIRKCDVIIRHVVYDDESIWNYEGDEIFAQVDEQQPLNLPDGLNDEFKRQMTMAVPGVNYEYAPEDRGAYWFCACGQLNMPGAESCIACGADRSREFGLMDIAFLSEAREKHIEEERIAREAAEQQEAERKAQEEALKAQKIAERNQKIEEAQKKAKEAFGAMKNKGAEYYAKGEEKIKGAAVFQKSGNAGAALSGQVCPKCGKPYNQGDKFCMGCGTKLSQPEASPQPEAVQPLHVQPEVKICAKCGMKNDADSKFCMGCGNVLTDMETMEEEPKTEVIQAEESQEPKPHVSYTPSQQTSVPAQEKEDQDELKTLVLTPEMAAQMAAAHQKPEDGTGAASAIKKQEGKVICPACGYENDADSMFCMSCGSRIDE